jgi:hypothetical protein
MANITEIKGIMELPGGTASLFQCPFKRIGGVTMTDNYFKNHSDQELARLCLEQLRYIKTTKRAYSKSNEKESQYLQDLQAEIVHRFINKYKEEEIEKATY